MTDPKEQHNLNTTAPTPKKAILRNKIHSTLSKRAQAENFEILTPGGSRHPANQGEGGGGAAGVLLSVQAHFWDQVIEQHWSTGVGGQWALKSCGEGLSTKVRVIPVAM